MDSIRIAITHLIQYKNNYDVDNTGTFLTVDYTDGYNDAINDILDRLQSNEANQDTILECMLELVNSGVEDGYFIVLGQEILAKDMIAHLECDDDFGHEFRKELTNTTMVYLLKFRG